MQLAVSAILGNVLSFAHVAWECSALALALALALASCCSFTAISCFMNLLFAYQDHQVSCNHHQVSCNHNQVSGIHHKVSGTQTDEFLQLALVSNETRCL